MKNKFLNRHRASTFLRSFHFQQKSRFWKGVKERMKYLQGKKKKEEQEREKKKKERLLNEIVF